MGYHKKTSNWIFGIIEGEESKSLAENCPNLERELDIKYHKANRSPYCIKDLLQDTL